MLSTHSVLWRFLIPVDLPVSCSVSGIYTSVAYVINVPYSTVKPKRTMSRYQHSTTVTVDNTVRYITLKYSKVV